MIDENELIKEIDYYIRCHDREWGYNINMADSIRQYGLPTIGALEAKALIHGRARDNFRKLKDFVLEKSQAIKKTCIKKECSLDRDFLPPYCPAHTEEEVKIRTNTCLEKGCDRQKATGGIYCKKHTEKITKRKKCAFPKCKDRVEPFSIYCTWHQDHDLD